VTLRSRTIALLAGAALATISAPAFAEQINLFATLSPSAEPEPVQSSGTGTLDATYDTETNVLTWNISYMELTGPADAAHFHGPADPGQNAPPVVPVDGPLTSPITGEATLTEEQEADLLAGKWYFNIHTGKYPGGEIRGQVTQGEAPATDAPMDASSSEMSSSEDSSSSSSAM
jgi:hypothetical protein